MRIFEKGTVYAQNGLVWSEAVSKRRHPGTSECIYLILYYKLDTLRVSLRCDIIKVESFCDSDLLQSGFTRFFRILLALFLK